MPVNHQDCPNILPATVPGMQSQSTVSSRHVGDRDLAPAVAPERHEHGEPSRAIQIREGSNKRRRVGLACQSCRARKSRCDGVRPKCAACISYGNDCVYQQGPTVPTVVVGREYLSSVEDRLNGLEKLLSSVVRRVSNVPEGEETQMYTSVSETTPMAESIDDDAEGDGTGEDIDGMGVASFAQDDICSFFGPSSNISFMQELSRAIARVNRNGQLWVPNSSPENASFAESTYINVSWPTSPTSRRPNGRSQPDQVDLYALPPQQQADDMISQYFTIMQMLFPYLHKETFYSTYEQVKKSNYVKVRKTWLTLLNAMFAIATSAASEVSYNAERRTSESEVYFQRASGLCIPQVLRGRGVNLEIVISLLLMSQYLQGTQRSVQPWLIHGLAVKAALQLGLHSEEASKSFPPIEQEMRKRTWFGIVNLDRTLSMTFGRPTVIPQSQIRLELPVPYERLVPNPEPPLGEPHDRDSVSFFIASIHLYEIMTDVIDELYSQNLGCSEDPNAIEMVARIYKVENKLLEWQRNLPLHLPLISPSTNRSEDSNDEGPDAWLIHRFRVVLTLRYLNLRILLYRPILAKYLDILENPNLDKSDLIQLQQTGARCVQVCVCTSVSLITLIHSIVSKPGRRRQLLGAWWFSLYYIFNATLVIIAGLIVARREKTGEAALEISIEEAYNSIAESVEAMRQLDDGNRLVSKCQDCIEQLSLTLDSLTSQYSDIVEDPQFSAPVNGDGPAAYIESAFPEAAQPGMDLRDYLFPVADLQFFGGSFPGTGGDFSDIINNPT